MSTARREEQSEVDANPVARGLFTHRPTSWVWVCALSAIFAALLYLTLGQSFRFSGYGEGLYDLHYIAGGWLDQGWPTPEIWRPGEQVTHYYNLGLAAWGELGAALGLSLGATYVLGLIILPSLVFAAILRIAGGPLPLRGLVALIATFPASGISLWIGLGVIELPGHLQNMGHVRLVEWADRAGGSFIGQALVTGHAYPLESLAYIIFELQDFHPPVLGFLILAVVLGAFLGNGQPRSAPKRNRDLLWGLLPGASLVVAYAVNAWMTPFLLGLTGCALLLRWRLWAVLGALLGAALAYALLWPLFFRYFAPPDAVQVTWLSPEFRSEWKSWVLIWAPCLLATAWWLLASVTRKRLGHDLSWAEVLFPLVFLAAALSLEVVHLDDPYGGNFERFNSVLKTGSLALAGWVSVLLVLASRQRKIAVWLPILVVLGSPALMQLFDLGARMQRESNRVNWNLDSAVMIAEEDLRESYRKLQGEEPGTTLEFNDDTAYSIVPVVSTLAAFPTWSGWSSHLAQVGAFSEQDWKTRGALQNWYKHFPPDNGVLDTYGIDYILVRYALNWPDYAIAERREVLGSAWEWVPASQDHRGNWAGYFRRQR